MFFRTKKSGPRTYLQIVENHRVGGQIKQRVIATLGRLEELQGSGQLESLLRSGAGLPKRSCSSVPIKTGNSPR